MTFHSSRSGRWNLALAFFVVIGLSACAARFLQHEHADEVLKNKEFEDKVMIKTVETPPKVEVQPLPSMPQPEAEKAGKKRKGIAKGKVSPQKEAVKAKGPRQPELEDAEGFDGRRPLKDPFRVGEKVTLSLSYFSVNAGTMDIEVKPFVEVNGEKAYHFQVSARSNSFFSRIYAVDDVAKTYMSFKEMTPMSLEISIKESKQLAETRTFFDWKNLKASYWQKRITQENGEQSKKLEWNIHNFSQNVVSAAYYLRTFKYDIGKNLSFRVADEGKNIIYAGEVLRKEKLSTDIGDLDTIVVRPKLTVDGVFSPVGEILLWITDDDRKFIVRIESKIKIGTVVAKLKSIEKGLE